MHNDWIESAWAAHSCDLRHYARGYCGNVEQAEDAVQDAFLKLQQTTPAVAGDPPRPWLFRVVRNRLIDLASPFAARAAQRHLACLGGGCRRPRRGYRGH